MLEIVKMVEATIMSLDMVEVRGQNNLALLYNSLDNLKQVLEKLRNMGHEPAGATSDE